MQLRAVLSQLVDEELVAADIADASVSRLATRRAGEEAAPWFVRLLVGCSAWIAALLLLAFLGLFALLATKVFAPLGVVLAVVAILMRRAQAQSVEPAGVASDFWGQAALLGTFLARLLVAVGTVELTDSLRVAAVALLTLEAVFFLYYPDTLQRFVVPIASGAWLMVLVFDQPFPGAREAVVVLASALTGYVWLQQAELLRGQYRAWQAPVGYGLATFVCGALLIGVSLASFWSEGERVPWVATAGMAVLALVLFARVLEAHAVPLASRVGIAGAALIVVFAVITWREPGLLAAASLLALGFHCRSRPLMVLAVFFLAGFGVHFYYQMDLDFLRKSAVLLGSGLAMLAVWAGLRRFSKPAVSEPNLEGA